MFSFEKALHTWNRKLYSFLSSELRALPALSFYFWFFLSERKKQLLVFSISSLLVGDDNSLVEC